MVSETIKTAAFMVKSFMSINMKNRYALNRSYDIWTCRQILADKRRDYLIEKQKLKFASHAELGSDLAVAHFVTSNRGKIKDSVGKWISDSDDLPKNFDEKFRLIEIDASRCSIVTEGTDNFVGLDYLKSLDLSENILLDDNACDQLSRQFRHSKSLQEINLSLNPFISVYGLEILLRIPSLRKIVARGTQASNYEGIDLFALAAQDECDCKILVHQNNTQFIRPELEDLYNSELYLEGGIQKKLLSEPHA